MRKVAIFCIALLLFIPAAVSAKTMENIVIKELETFEVNDTPQLQSFDTDSFTYATKVAEGSRPVLNGVLVNNILYSFNFLFDSNLTSKSFENPTDNNTIEIWSAALWVDDEARDQFNGSNYNYYDIKLTCDGDNQGTVRYDIEAGQQSGTWYNVPAGSCYFTMSKHVLTWSIVIDGEEIFNGDIYGSGTVED